MNAAYNHPYRNLPDYAFWKQGVAEAKKETFDPVVSVPFLISKDDKVATAGSCFAQHISKAIAADGFNFLQTEAPGGAGTPIYSARYGNIYTCKQLRQLFDQAYGLFIPKDKAWRRKDGRFVDPFRPQEFIEGFENVDEVLKERKIHLEAVRNLFESANAFVFTLGLTESWIATTDGSALPVPPGVMSSPEEIADYVPVNQNVAAMTSDLLEFVDKLRSVNPSINIILTVSPVPLVATFEKRHVLVSNTYSKSALRVVAEQVINQRTNIMYFPSFEIVSAMPNFKMFEDDLRSVSPDAVAYVMSIFKKSCLSGAMNDKIHSIDVASRIKSEYDQTIRVSKALNVNQFDGVICDEEMLGKVR